MRGRQMKLHGEQAPCHFPNGLNVWAAFKFSITQFTSIYLLEWLAFPVITVHIHKWVAEGFFLLQIRHIFTHYGTFRQMCQIVELFGTFGNWWYSFSVEWVLCYSRYFKKGIKTNKTGDFTYGTKRKSNSNSGKDGVGRVKDSKVKATSRRRDKK